ncbi:MAG: phenazine biosynthesis protein PhzE [Polyangiaceae bacterium]|jgi:phenazine biosynthesis protein phzE|nr:phenazine biosynthesis protein PhzE [Polyangiaceae bacterium]
MLRFPMKFDAPYCLTHQDGKTHYATGEIRKQRLLSEVPRRGRWPVFSMVPYTQLRERGFEVHDGGEEILSLVTSEYREVSLADLVPGEAPQVRTLGAPTFVMDDAEFEANVARLIKEEICQGEGSNFLLSRKARVTIADFDWKVANTIFQRLARNEFGAYMTFCFYDGERFFVGSSPERHVTIRKGVVRMNPISGTLPRSVLKQRSDLIEFLSDAKEVNELFQVVDEELKMMSRICSSGGDVHGPYLKEMSSLIHTEYVLQGHTDGDYMDAFRDSMFAATMIGSPLENAARVIKKYERESRRYYSSALLVTGFDEDGQEYLDSAITIRTMEVSLQGEATIQSGASIVRDSVPQNECREVKTKAAGVLRAIESSEPSKPYLAQFRDAKVDQVLESRNKYLSRFWMEKQHHSYVEPRVEGKSILIIDNEDEFTHMLKHVLTHLGMRARVVDHREAAPLVAEAELVLVGPGPGDPTDLADPKMKIVHGIVQGLLDRQAKFMAVCLGHQILSYRLGMKVEPRDPPLQGVQMSIDLFGRREPVGFYNTFFAQLPPSPLPGLEIASEPDGRVTALRSENFCSFQFHVESVLTTNSIPILRDALLWLVAGKVPSEPPGAG